jgi:dephospho-CoA kinase
MNRIFLITGRIGSGKSTVAYMIEQRGHRVIKLDNFAKDLAKTSEAKFKYLEIFGKEALNDDASLNIDYLKKVFFKPENKEKREHYNQFVFTKFLDWFETDEHSVYEPIFIEAPETELCHDYLCATYGEKYYYDRKIVVRISDNSVRYNRVMQRNELCWNKIKERDLTQYDSKLKEKDIVINNDKGISELFDQVTDLLENKLNFTNEERASVFNKLVNLAPQFVHDNIYCYLYYNNRGCSSCPFPCARAEKHFNEVKKGFLEKQPSHKQ